MQGLIFLLNQATLGKNRSLAPQIVTNSFKTSEKSREKMNFFLTTAQKSTQLLDFSLISKNKSNFT